MRRFCASILIVLVLAIGGASAAHAEGRTITIEQGGYTYTCSTEAQPKENMKMKVDGVQYTCYSEDRGKGAFGPSGGEFIIALIFCAILFWLGFQIISS